MHPSDGLTFVPQLIALIFVYPKQKLLPFLPGLKLSTESWTALESYSLNLIFSTRHYLSLISYLYIFGIKVFFPFLKKLRTGWFNI